MPEPSHGTIPSEDVAVAALTQGISADTRGVGKPRSLWSDAWHDLRRNPMFVISALLILFLVVLAVFPGLFTTTDPRFCELSSSNGVRRRGTRSDSTDGAVTSIRG